MSYEQFLIADFKSGLITDVEPWLLPSDAFSEVDNAYFKHGVIRKRLGLELLGQMVWQVTTITAISNSDPGVVTVASAASLSEGLEIQISYADGDQFSSLNGLKLVVTNLDVGAKTFELYTTDGDPLDTTTYGAYIGSGVVSIFSDEPIMGIKSFTFDQFENTTAIWDTRRMAVFNSSNNTFDPIDTSAILSGDYTNFISVAYYAKTNFFTTPTVFFTNYTGNQSGVVDSMRTYVNGATTTTVFRPQTSTVGAGSYVDTAQFIHVLGGRLLLFNTVETLNGVGLNYFQQRVRWSTTFNPDAATPNWDDITPGKGGYADAPSSGVIIDTNYLNDEIIVFFSDSTWKLVQASDPRAPFRWIKLNSFRSSNAPQGSLSYDKYVISFGQRGIFATDGVETKRVDDGIQSFTKENMNISQASQIYSERDYSERISWTLYPSANTDTTLGEEQITSDKALIRNDEHVNFSTFTLQVPDSNGNLQNMSCLGHAVSEVDALASDFDGIILPEYTFDDPDVQEMTFFSWYFQNDAEMMVGGDQVGRVFMLNFGSTDYGNDIAMTLRSSAWNPFKNEGARCEFGYVDIFADSDQTATLTIDFFKDDRTDPYTSATNHLLPDIGFLAEINTISQANPCVVTAQNHGLSTGQVVYVYGVLGMSDILGGPYTITVIDESNFSLDDIDSSAYSDYEGSGQVTENPFVATKVWKRFYAGGTGYSHFIDLSSIGHDQIVNIHAFKCAFKKVGSRMIT